MPVCPHSIQGNGVQLDRHCMHRERIYCEMHHVYHCSTCDVEDFRKRSGVDRGKINVKWD
jgi:hypothetical protein